MSAAVSTAAVVSVVTVTGGVCWKAAEVEPSSASSCFASSSLSSPSGSSCLSSPARVPAVVVVLRRPELIPGCATGEASTAAAAAAADAADADADAAVDDDDGDEATRSEAAGIVSVTPHLAMRSALMLRLGELKERGEL